MDKKIIIEATIKELSYLKIDKEYYQRPGVWALYGLDCNDNWICLEVGQTVNIYSELKSAIYILTTHDDDKCKTCSKTYTARRKFKEYSTKFDVHKCKGCSHTSELRISSWKRNPRYIDKYKNMLKQSYIKFKFECVDISVSMHNDKMRKLLEKQYAKENKALYWYG